jgi:hypothetical protein
MTFAVKNPEIAEVLDMRSGDHWLTSALISREYDEVMRLRMAARASIVDGKPRYTCAICGVPVYLCCLKQARRFFFRHMREDGSCPAITKGALSQAQIDARKYNGAKESDLHKTMKTWVARSLEADPRFRNIEIEGTWKGKLNDDWRRPDVRAYYGNIPVVFEIQLSTAHLNVIAERRQFYLREGGMLLWVFARFDATSRPLTQDDVFFNNNQNAFLVDATTLASSEAQREMVLECLWAEPLPGRAVSPLRRARVGFSSLTLDQQEQRVFYYDFDGEKDKLRLLEQRQALDTLREDFYRFWTNCYGRVQAEPGWPALAKRLKDAGALVPPYPDTALFNALYAARKGIGVNRGYSSLVEIAHQLHRNHPRHIPIFLHAIRVYGKERVFKGQDRSGAWAAIAAEVERSRGAGEPTFEPDKRQYPFVRFLLPEVFQPIDAPAKSDGC